VLNLVSNVFHQLQLALAELSLAEKQLALADEMYGHDKKNSSRAVVRYLTPLEEMRLTIIREEARQTAGSAEGKYKEVLSEFVKLLAIEADSVTSVSELLPVSNNSRYRSADGIAEQSCATVQSAAGSTGGES